MFDVSTSTASFAVGAIAVLAAVLSQLASGLWISRRKPSVQRQLLFGLVCSILAFLFALHPLYKCEETIFIGSNLSYDAFRSNSSRLDITSYDRFLTSFLILSIILLKVIILLITVPHKTLLVTPALWTSSIPYVSTTSTLSSPLVMLVATRAMSLL